MKKDDKLIFRIVPVSDTEAKNLVISRTITQDGSGCKVVAQCPNGKQITCSSNTPYTCQEVYKNVNNSGTLELLGIRCGDVTLDCYGDSSGSGSGSGSGSNSGCNSGSGSGCNSHHATDEGLL